MNTYKKYCPNVFVAVCEEEHKKGDTIVVTTRYGGENECIVHNFVGYTGDKENPKYCYSITRVDGFDYQAWCQKRADKFAGRSVSAHNKSMEHRKKSDRDKDFLSLGEPIKVGHHSEKRHRKILEYAQNQMFKFVEFYRKAEDLEERATYWESRATEINLSMPESLEYYEIKLYKAIEYHQGMKDGEIPRAHSYSLTYAKKEVNNLKKKLEQAQKLWA